MDLVTSTYILAQVERELDAQVREQNTMSKAREAIRSMKGAIGRVTDDILKTAAEVAAAEQEAKDVAASTKALQFREFDAIKGELYEIINELKDVGNGAPAGPLPGEAQLASSESVSVITTPGYPAGFIKPQS